MGNKTQNKATAQPYSNGNDCVSRELPLMGTYEKKIAKIKKSLQHIDNWVWETEDVVLLKKYWNDRLKYYQSKMNEAHTGLTDELTSNLN